MTWDMPKTRRRTDAAAETFQEEHWEREPETPAFANNDAARVGRVAAGASDDDLSLDSPNSLHGQISALHARGFRRENDPRRRR
jgi:hypothetical protein